MTPRTHICKDCNTPMYRYPVPDIGVTYICPDCLALDASFAVAQRIDELGCEIDILLAFTRDHPEIWPHASSHQPPFSDFSDEQKEDKTMNYTRSTADAAAHFAVTDRTIRNWCQAGRLPAVKAGGVWRIADIASIPARPRPRKATGQGEKENQFNLF